ncbi:DASH complex subunit Dad1 [Kalmanozyma brasiliensis GHG001]|uniref:DASH complex subunit DAD1 n=1 Tax=Kalmanozyma brasiliensis (strain GHG001) TaxID=1365824 RepID=V5EXM6_KALBG|nr:DASH complex subunit Dad1 [Kalmanozyma brasiliensis GHG001]EST08288.1 DASH complex subunit Dad1 [Kalmanozyma brasiliensis GHG001]
MMDTHTYDDQHPSSSSSNGNGAIDAGFFERERNRLIQDISKGVESVLGNSNVLNRKIEESISVGKEFHPISELWSKFERIMVASGIPDLYPQAHTSKGSEGNAGMEDKENALQGAATPGKKTPTQAGAAEGENGEGIRFELTQTALPPGVAPGGGRIYA